jgi:hypothetical protein
LAVADALEERATAIPIAAWKESMLAAGTLSPVLMRFVARECTHVTSCSPLRAMISATAFRPVPSIGNGSPSANVRYMR